MKMDLLSIDRLSTLEELKEFFKNNDWTTAKIDETATRTPEEQAEIEYTAELMDEHFEKIVLKKGRTSVARFYGKD